MKLYSLKLSWSVSRGRDTYGYNICRLDVQSPNAERPWQTDSMRYRCNGGGYDMVGTVVAEWLQTSFQDRLRVYLSTGGTERLCGLRLLLKDNKATALLDGACGIDSVIRIAEAIGLEFQRTHDRKGNTTGWIVEDTTQRLSVESAAV